MEKKEWLQLPRIIRLWRIKYCKHPFLESAKVGFIRQPQLDQPPYQYVINVRKCGNCMAYFLDPGMES